MSASVLLHAAELLEREAAALQESHTRDGYWHIVDPVDASALREHDDMVATAKQLRDVAQALSWPPSRRSFR